MQAIRYGTVPNTRTTHFTFASPSSGSTAYDVDMDQLNSEQQDKQQHSPPKKNSKGTMRRRSSTDSCPSFYYTVVVKDSKSPTRNTRFPDGIIYGFLLGLSIH
jgi:hypothetical protein